MSDAPHEPDPSAAELALGVLEGEDRAAAERRRLAEPTFAREVDDWSVRLGRIAEDEAAERTPSAGVWPAIVRRLGETSGVVELRLRRSLILWRSIAGGAGAVAAALAVGLLVRPAAPPLPAPITAAPAAAPGPLQAASLSTAQGGRVTFVAVLDEARGELVLTPVSISGQPGKSPELWVIPTGGQPISLGVAQFGQSVRLKVKDIVGGEAARTLAVTLEARGGSPTGKPQGPVIASGKLQAL